MSGPTGETGSENAARGPYAAGKGTYTSRAYP